jgi:Flp pilus assembly protein TadG
MIRQFDWKQVYGRQQATSWLRLFVNGEAGSSLIEFALSISLLLTVVFGIMGLSLAAYADHFVALAAQAATRYAAVRGSTWTGTCASATAASCIATTGTVQSYVQSITPGGVTYSNVTVQTTWPGTTPAGAPCFEVSGANSPGCMVKVTVKYSFSFLLPFMPTGVMNLSSTGALPIAQ